MRATTYTAILYPETLKKNWENILTATKYQWVCSPLHDHDVFKDNKKPDKNGNGGHSKGELKKAHFHIAIYFGPGVKKSIKQAMEIISNALKDDKYIPEPQPSRNMNKLIQYFVHQNDQSKYQYCKDDIRAFNGFDVDKYLKSNSDISSDLKEIFRFAKNNKLLNAQVLFDRILEERPELGNTLVKKFYAINTYIVALSKNYERNGNKIPRTKEELEPVLKFLEVLKLVILIKEKEELEYEKEFAQILKENEKNKKTTENSKPALTKKKDKIFKQKNHYVNSETGEIVDFARVKNRVNKNFESQKIISLDKNFITNWKHTKP